MKLIQRIFLSYYSTKFRLLAIVSTHKAAKSAFELFCTPYSRRKTYKTPKAFENAQRLSFEFQQHTIRGFHWQSEVKNGYKVLICHGFDSLSYKFDEYINPLLNIGFEVLAFDAPGHGLSTGKTINILLYKEMILEACNQHGPFDGIMAHSFAGIAVTLAIEELKGKAPKRLVLIAPATETTRSLHDFCRHLYINNQVRAGIEDLIWQVGKQPVGWYSVARLIKTLSTRTLWIHDKNDRITPYDDMKDLLQMNLPHVEFVITEGLGHSLYRDEKVAKKIVDFLGQLKNQNH